MNVPSINECLAMMNQYAMLDNIREHSFIVARVAETVTANLDVPGTGGLTAPAMDLVLAGALLHDIAKTRCLDGSCQHAEEGMRICRQHGYPEVGRIVQEHVILSAFTPENYRKGKFSAREIVYYADKRVRHNEIVSLDLRLDYIIDHYSRGSEHIRQRIRDNFALCLEFEQHLFSFLPFTPADLPRWVDDRPFGVD